MMEDKRMRIEYRHAEGHPLQKWNHLCQQGIWHRRLSGVLLLLVLVLLLAETAFGQSVYLEREESRAKNTGGYDLNLYYDGASHITHIAAEGNLKDSLKAHEKFEYLKAHSTTWKLTSQNTGIAEVSTPVKTSGTNGTFYYDLYPSTTLHIPAGYETQSAACIDKISGEEEVFEAKGFRAGQSGDYTLPIGGRTANWGISTDMIKSGLHYYYNMDLEYRITLRPKEYRLYLAPGQGLYQGRSGMTWQSVTYHDTAGNAPGPASCKGYRFDGWFTMDGTAVFDAEGHWIAGDYWDAAGRWIGTEALIVFAQWTKIDDFSFTKTVTGIEFEDFAPDDSGSADFRFRLGDGEKIFFPGLEDGAMYRIEEEGTKGLRASCQLQEDGRQTSLHAKAGASLRTPTRVLASDAAAAFVNAADEGTVGGEGSDGDDQPLCDLAVRKEYDGVYDAASVRASFRVQLTGLAAGETYAARLCDDAGEIIRSEYFTAAEDGSASYAFSLRDTQSMQLLALPASVRYQIIEEADAKAAPSYVLTSEETAGVHAVEGRAEKGEPLSTPVEAMGADRSYSFYNCIETRPVKTVRNELAGTGDGDTENAKASGGANHSTEGAGAENAASADAKGSAEHAGATNTADGSEMTDAAEGSQNRVDSLDDAWIYHIHQDVEVPTRSFRVYDTLPPYVRILGLPGQAGQTSRTAISGEPGGMTGGPDLRSCGLRAFWRSPDGVIYGGDVTAQDARTGEYLIRGVSGEDSDAVLFRIRYDAEDGEEITLQVTAEDENMMLQGGNFDLYFLAGVAPEASHEQLVAADCYRNGNYRFVNEVSTVIGEYLCTSQPVTTRVLGPAVSHDLILQKNVTGDLGDRTKNFTFQVDFTGLNPGERYATPVSEALLAAVMSAEENTNPESSPSAARCIPVTADAQGCASITVPLQDDEAAVFPGLPRGVKYQIREVASNHAPSYRQRMLTAEGTSQWIAWMTAKASAGTVGDVPQASEAAGTSKFSGASFKAAEVDSSETAGASAAKGAPAAVGGSAATHNSGTDSADDFDEWLEGEEEEFRQVYHGDVEDQPFHTSEDAAGRAGQPLQTETETVGGDVDETILVTFTNHRNLATITGVMGGRALWPVTAAILFGGGALHVWAGRRRRALLLLGTAQEASPETMGVCRCQRGLPLRR